MSANETPVLLYGKPIYPVADEATGLFDGTASSGHTSIVYQLATSVWADGGRVHVCGEAGNIFNILQSQVDHYDTWNDLWYHATLFHTHRSRPNPGDLAPLLIVFSGPGPHDATAKLNLLTENAHHTKMIIVNIERGAK